MEFIDIVGITFLLLAILTPIIMLRTKKRKPQQKPSKPKIDFSYNEPEPVGGELADFQQSAN